MTRSETAELALIRPGPSHFRVSGDRSEPPGFSVEPDRHFEDGEPPVYSLGLKMAASHRTHPASIASFLLQPFFDWLKLFLMGVKKEPLRLCP